MTESSLKKLRGNIHQTPNGNINPEVHRLDIALTNSSEA
jgi:hypothetical protein